MATVIESWSLRVKSCRNFDSWQCPCTSAPSQEQYNPARTSTLLARPLLYVALVPATVKSEECVDGVMLRVAESRRCGATSCAGCRIDYQAHGRTDALRDQSRTKWRRGNKYFTVISSLLDSFLPPGAQLRGRQCSNVGSICLHTE